MLFGGIPVVQDNVAIKAKTRRLPDFFERRDLK
jgi:hypothetical protein